MPAVASRPSSALSDAAVRDAELQEATRRDALEVLSLQLDMEKSQVESATRRDTTWSALLLGAAVGAGVGLGRRRAKKTKTRSRP